MAASYLHVTFVSAQTNTQEYKMDHRRINPAHVHIFFLPTFKLKSTPVLLENANAMKEKEKKKIPPPRLQPNKPDIFSCDIPRGRNKAARCFLKLFFFFFLETTTGTRNTLV